jgi:membrane protein
MKKYDEGRSAAAEVGFFLFALPLATLLLGVAAGFDLARTPASSLEPNISEQRPGRDAANPAQMPLQAWRQIGLRTWKEFNADHIPAVAAGVTFFSLLALFPALGAFVSLYGLISNVEDARRQVIGMGGVLPGGAVTVIGDQMTRLTTTNHTHLGFAFATGLLISIWSANAGVKALMSGLNVAYEEREKRGFIKLNLISLTFTVGLTVFAVAGIAAVVGAPQVLTTLGLSRFQGESLLRWPLIVAVTIGLLALLYRFGPSREHARWRWITPGSILAAVLWMAMSVGFSLYVANFGHYDRTYGPLGAMIGFMTWIWLSVTVVLLGAELNSELEQQTSVDTTTGPPEPVGQRGASVADHGPGERVHIAEIGKTNSDRTLGMRVWRSRRDQEKRG